MAKLAPFKLRRRIKRIYHRMGGSEVVKRHDASRQFAHKHNLVYFHTLPDEDPQAPAVRGATASVGHADSNYCIGTHDSYDMVCIERANEITFGNYEPSLHYWYVLEIDLKNAKDLPFVFVGTKQQPKAFYARVLASRRGASYLQPSSTSIHAASFHANYAVITSPLQADFIHRLFTNDVVDVLASHKHPFAFEIEGDSLFVFTEAKKPSEQLLNKLLHHGLWLAKVIDERF